MKTFTLIFLFSLIITGLIGQTTHVVQVSGFSYVPADLTIQAGDSVRFDGSANHPVLQVSQATWNADGTTALAGGFSFPEGSGKVGFPNAGTIYYVCTFHVASNGMKGKITVTAATALDPSLKSDQPLLYPVPLSGNELTLRFNETATVPVIVKVYNTDGRQLKVFSGNTSNGTFQLNCSELNKGTYLLKTQTDKSTWVTKFIRL